MPSSRTTLSIYWFVRPHSSYLYNSQRIASSHTVKSAFVLILSQRTTFVYYMTDDFISAEKRHLLFGFVLSTFTLIYLILIQFFWDFTNKHFVSFFKCPLRNRMYSIIIIVVMVISSSNPIYLEFIHWDQVENLTIMSNL